MAKSHRRSLEARYLPLIGVLNRNFITFRITFTTFRITAIPATVGTVLVTLVR